MIVSHRSKIPKPEKIPEQPSLSALLCQEITCGKNNASDCEPNCPYGFDLIILSEKPCRYRCLPTKPPLNKACQIRGRHINTFDKTEYEYNLCDHVLARERYYNNWFVIGMLILQFFLFFLSPMNECLFKNYNSNV